MKSLGTLGYVLIGFLAAWLWAPRKDHVPYPEVIVPAARIIKREPDTVRTFVDRIRFVNVQPILVARAPGGAQGEVAAFCRPTLLALTDTVEVEPPAPRLLLRSGVHSPGWFFQQARRLRTGPTSLGDLQALDFPVRPGFTFRTSGDSVLVRYPRSGLGRELLEFGITLAGGYMLGRTIGR